ncbi:MAG: flagellar hook-length control protein FliK [Oscillospiraceae bacterium]|jgi:flagellar hook-length control protein FliK|nr:flagellar hook-length control protein FliK [Oscillospiraceae bacterium]
MNVTSAVSLPYSAAAVPSDARAGPETTFADCLRGEMGKSAFPGGEAGGGFSELAGGGGGGGGETGEQTAFIDDAADGIILAYFIPNSRSAEETPDIPKKRALIKAGTEETAENAATKGGEQAETKTLGEAGVFKVQKRADAEKETERFMAANAEPTGETAVHGAAGVLKVPEFYETGGTAAETTRESAAPPVLTGGETAEKAFLTAYAGANAQTDGETPATFGLSETPAEKGRAKSETFKPFFPNVPNEKAAPGAGLSANQGGVTPARQTERIEIEEVRFRTTERFAQPGQTAGLKEMTEGFLRPVIKENGEIRELLASMKAERPENSAPKTETAPPRVKFIAEEAPEGKSPESAGSFEGLREKGNPEVFRAAVQTCEAIMEKFAAFKGKSAVTSFEMTLNPQSLGKVTIKLTSKDGVLAVKIIADNPQTREMLAGRAGAVREILEQNGITVEKYEVAQSPLQTREARREFSGDDGGGGNRRNYDGDGGGDDDDESEFSFAEIVGAMA